MSNIKLQKLITLLDEIASGFDEYSSEKRSFAEINGWNWPAVTYDDLALFASSLSVSLEKASYVVIDSDLEKRIDSCFKNLEILKSNTIRYIFNGNGQQAIPAYLSTMETVKLALMPIIGWDVLIENKSLPRQLSNRLRSVEAELSEIIPKKEDIISQIQLIQNATETAESLPADLQSLKEARAKVNNFTTDAAELMGKIKSYYEDIEKAVKSVNGHEKEAQQIVAQCEEAYRVTTSKGLAAAFDERAKTSTTTMWIWVAGLVAALSLGAWIGSIRIILLTNALSATNPDWGIIWMQFSLSLLSLGAPLWFAWLSTKQINQRFRISEDYAYKASVSKAYEGYRREAVRIDESFEARLFATALTRLEEAPLRLVENDPHGSPWHELFASKPFQNALESIPGFRDKFVEVAKESLNTVKESVKSVKNHTDEAEE